MKQPLATLSFDSLQRRWRALTREDVEAVRDEEQLVALIASRTADDHQTIRRLLAEARKEAEFLLGPGAERRGGATSQAGG